MTVTSAEELSTTSCDSLFSLSATFEESHVVNERVGPTIQTRCLPLVEKSMQWVPLCPIRLSGLNTSRHELVVVSKGRFDWEVPFLQHRVPQNIRLRPPAATGCTFDSFSLMLSSDSQTRSILPCDFQLTHRGWCCERRMPLASDSKPPILG